MRKISQGKDGFPGMTMQEGIPALGAAESLTKSDFLAERIGFPSLGSSLFQQSFLA